MRFVSNGDCNFINVWESAEVTRTSLDQVSMKNVIAECHVFSRAAILKLMQIVLKGILSQELEAFLMP